MANIYVIPSLSYSLFLPLAVSLKQQQQQQQHQTSVINCILQSSKPVIVLFELNDRPKTMRMNAALNS